MNLVKYLIAGGVALVIGVIVMFMANFFSGILVFIGLFSGYIMWNVIKNITPDVPKETEIPKKDTQNPPMDN